MSTGTDFTGTRRRWSAPWAGPLPRRPRIGVVGLTLIGMVLLAGASWAFILIPRDSGFEDLLLGDTWDRAGDFLGALVGKGSDSEAAFTKLDRWAHAGKLAYETLAMSVLAIAFAAGAVLLTFLPAARNVAMGELSPSRGKSWPLVGLYAALRGFFIFTRGVPELVWAMIIIFFLSPGILPGALALAVHNYGILGRLSSELVENADTRPARALRASGAGGFQMLAYSILPQVLPQFITYVLYRWEVVIRTTIVVGFVSAGGLGLDFRLGMSFFHYTEVTLLLVWYVILVIGVDALSAWLRNRVRS